MGFNKQSASFTDKEAGGAREFRWGWKRDEAALKKTVIEPEGWKIRADAAWGHILLEMEEENNIKLNKWVY